MHFRAFLKTSTKRHVRSRTVLRPALYTRLARLFFRLSVHPFHTGS